MVHNKPTSRISFRAGTTKDYPNHSNYFQFWKWRKAIPMSVRKALESTGSLRELPSSNCSSPFYGPPMKSVLAVFYTKGRSRTSLRPCRLASLYRPVHSQTSSFKNCSCWSDFSGHSPICQRPIKHSYPINVVFQAWECAIKWSKNKYFFSFFTFSNED